MDLLDHIIFAYITILGRSRLWIAAFAIFHSRQVDADLGRLMVAYKETPTISHTEDFYFERNVADKRHAVNVTIRVTPSHKDGELGEKPVWSISLGDQGSDKKVT